MIFSAVKKFSLVEEIEELATVDLIERDIQVKFRITVKHCYYVICCQ
jgi:hypothetical protein